MRRTLVHFATLALLWAVLSQLNDALAPAHVYLWAGGLFVVYGALTLPFRGGLAASLAAGLLCDATTPVGFGTQALLFAAVHVVLFNLRDRVPRDETAARVVIALLTNLALFLAFAFGEVSRLPEPAAVWPRIIFDLLCSQVLITLVAPWFFALQERSLELARPLTESYGRRFE